MLTTIRCGPTAATAILTTLKPERRQQRTVDGHPATFTRVYLGKNGAFWGLDVVGAVQSWCDSDGKPLAHPPDTRRILCMPDGTERDLDETEADLVPTIGDNLPLMIGKPRPWSEFDLVCRKIVAIRPASIASFDSMLEIARRLSGMWAPCQSAAGPTIRLGRGGRPHMGVLSAYVAGDRFRLSLMLCDMKIPSSPGESK